jgi:hypothetical protein
MNFYTYSKPEVDGRPSQPELVKCLAGFNHPVCFSYILHLFQSNYSVVPCTGPYHNHRTRVRQNDTLQA